MCVNLENEVADFAEKAIAEYGKPKYAPEEVTNYALSVLADYLVAHAEDKCVF